MFDNRTVLEKYNQDGYVHLKKVFSDQEIKSIRRAIASIGESKIESDVLAHPSLRWILFDKRVLGPFREILGANLVYFGDSAIRNESHVGTRGFHRDSQDDFEDPSCTEYTIARLGLYLQDHSKYSGGLKVRKGSHRHEFIGRKNIKRALFGGPLGPLSFGALKIGKSFNLDIEVGDLVIWNLRLWHSGYAVRLKFWPKVCINPKFEKYIPNSWTILMQYPRMAIFLALGVPSRNLATYISNRSKDASTRDKPEVRYFDCVEVIEMAKINNVILNFDMASGGLE